MGPMERPGTWFLQLHPPYLVAPVVLPFTENSRAKLLSLSDMLHAISDLRPSLDEARRKGKPIHMLEVGILPAVCSCRGL